MKRIIKFYRNSEDKCPVEDFFDSLSDDILTKIIAVFKLVENLDVVPVKFFKKLSGTKLFEVRVEWESNIYRFPCFFHKNSLVILTHGFRRKNRKHQRRSWKKHKNTEMIF